MAMHRKSDGSTLSFKGRAFTRFQTGSASSSVLYFPGCGDDLRLPFALSDEIGCRLYIPSSGMDYEYPESMMDALAIWKGMLREGENPDCTCIIGYLRGCSVALSLVLWCRDHGLPMPSSVFLVSPLSDSGESTEAGAYFRGADYDDPYAHVQYASPLGLPYMGVCGFGEDVCGIENLMMGCDQGFQIGILDGPSESESQIKSISRAISSHFRFG